MRVGLIAPAWLAMVLTVPLAGCQSSPANGGARGSAERPRAGEDAGDGGHGEGNANGEGNNGDGGDDTLRSEIVPLYDERTELEPEVLIDRGDAIVTRFGDRGRDRHAREDEFQSYDHYLSHYWEHRTARYVFVDKVGRGGNTIDVAFVSEWKLDLPEFRAWYAGTGTVAAYHGNYAPLFTVEGPATYDEDLNQVSEQGVQYKYSFSITSAITLEGEQVPLAVGQLMEFEPSQFLDAPPVGRDNYYGTTYLYEVGRGGLLPWYTVGEFENQSSERESSHKIPEAFWLGGRTTLPYQYSDEPDNHYMQLATNMAPRNAQHFVNGRRIHHTNMRDGSHDENVDNGTFKELAELAGPNYVNVSCDHCHKRNGRAPVAELGESLDKWVFKVADANGEKHPLLGAVLQPHAGDARSSEGSVSIEEWIENEEGLRTPRYTFTGPTPSLFSARLAPSLVGVGLLEAIAESTVLTYEDPNDQDGDGISGRAQVVLDPVTGQKRLGRLGWKAAASSVRHQVAAALNTDMGVMTSILPTPDCGASQADCGNTQGVELRDEHLTELVKYVSLLGVRARRGIDDAQAAQGEQLFEDMGCAGCHRSEMKTTAFHPFAELRNQTIHPYSDLLLHDMGEGLADTLGEGEASGAEWRTTPLWGLGLSACVTGGVTGPFQSQVCSPHASYLHDGRARTIEEAIRWHGGEGEASKNAFESATQSEKNALLHFLETL